MTQKQFVDYEKAKYKIDLQKMETKLVADYKQVVKQFGPLQLFDGKEISKCEKIDNIVSSLKYINQYNEWPEEEDDN